MLSSFGNNGLQRPRKSNPRNRQIFVNIKVFHLRLLILEINEKILIASKCTVFYKEFFDSPFVVRS